MAVASGIGMFTATGPRVFGLGGWPLAYDAAMVEGPLAGLVHHPRIRSLLLTICFLPAFPEICFNSGLAKEIPSLQKRWPKLRFL